MDVEIDRIDRRILYELDWNARQADTDLARKIKRSRETIRYRIMQLEKKKIILGYATWINPAKLGYSIYKIYMKMRGTEEEIKTFMDDIKKRDDVYWVGTAGGAWDIGITFFSKNSTDFFDRKNELLSKYSHLILQKFVGIISQTFRYPEKIFYKYEKEPQKIFTQPDNMKIDEIDRRILAELFHNARIKLVDLASKTKTSVDIVRGRMKRLERNGIICTYKARINFEGLGWDFYKAFLYFDLFSKYDEKKLFEIAKMNPNIVRIITIVAPWDVEVEMRVRNFQEFDSIIKKLKVEFPGLRNVESATLSKAIILPAKGIVESL